MSALIVGLIIALLIKPLFALVADDTLPEEKRDKGVVFFTVLEIFLWLALVPFAAGALSRVLHGELYLLPVPILVGALLLPWSFSVRVLVPLGLYRVAYYHGFFCLYTLASDLRGGALLLSTWAAVRRKSGVDEALAFVESRLAKDKRLIRGASVVAAAMIARRRGDAEAARALLDSLECIDPALFPVVARKIALTMRAVDRLAVGDAVGLRMLEMVPLIVGWPHSRLSRLLIGCAMRIVREPLLPGESAQPASSARLYLYWLLAPRRRTTRWLVERAAQRQPMEAPPAAAIQSVEPPKSGTALERAVAALRPLVATAQDRGAITAPMLISVGKAWDAVLADGAARSQVMSRTLVLGITSERGGEAALRTLRDEAVGLIQDAITSAGLPLADLASAGSDTLTRALQKVRNQILDEVEGAGQALRSRVDSKRALAAIDEWREWARYLSLYQAARRRGGVEAQRLAWPSFHREACHLAVWLWNDRKQRALGNAIFRYLLEEAVQIGDERTADLQRTNVECGL